MATNPQDVNPVDDDVAPWMMTIGFCSGGLVVIVAFALVVWAIYRWNCGGGQ